MDYQIRKAMNEDLPRIEEIYAYARKFMAENGNPNQWGTNTPPTDQLKDDIQKGDLYVLIHEDMIHGVFYFFIGPDPTYGYIDNGAWRQDTPYGAIHRVASRGGGVLKAALAYACAHYDHIRMDTHMDNAPMRHLLEKLGFSHRGTIYVEDGTPRMAFDLLEEDHGKNQ